MKNSLWLINLCSEKKPIVEADADSLMNYIIRLRSQYKMAMLSGRVGTD